MAKDKETMKEMFDRLVADPNIWESEMMKGAEKFGEAMDELTTKILDACMSYDSEGDPHWAHTMLISMARATCILTYTLEHSCGKMKDGKDPFDFYRNELLPLCKEVAYRECEQKVSEVRMKEQYGEMPDERRVALLRAVDDESRTPEDIAREFGRADLSDDDRQRLADHIAKARREHGELIHQTLAAFDEKQGEKGN